MAREETYLALLDSSESPAFLKQIYEARKIKKRKRKNKPPLRKDNFYSEYITSSAWQEKRVLRLAMEDALECWTCGTTTFTGGRHVHHRSYLNFRNEEMDDLVVTCADCNMSRIPKIVAVLKKHRLVSSKFQWYATDYVRRKHRGTAGPGCLLTDELFAQIGDRISGN